LVVQGSRPSLGPSHVDLIVPVAQGTLSTLKSTFLSLKDVPDEEIVLLSTLPDCQWDGLIEISPDTWKELKKCVSHVTVVLKAGESPVVLEDVSMVINRLLSSERASLEDNNNNNNNTTTTTTTTTTPGIPSLFSPRNAEARSSFVQTLPFKFPTQPK